MPNFILKIEILFKLRIELMMIRFQDFSDVFTLIGTKS